MPLSAEVTADLIAIRSLRDFAVQQAGVPGAVHRQVAVILLDAAIEQTVFTAAEFRGEAFTDRDQVDKPLQKLRELGLVVNKGVETSRKRLHRSRNVVQHAGVGVDAEELPRWALATQRFISDVVSYAYGVDIDFVRYSAAIENADVRMHLDSAEDLLHAGSIEDSMQSVIEAYNIAIGTWRKFVNGVSSDLHPRYARSTDFGFSMGGDDPKVVALQTVTVLTAIAPDPGEAVWFLQAKQQAELLLEDEVRRALVFVFSLAVAVEASPAARREDRRRRSAVAARHTRTDTAQPARLGAYSLTPSHDQEWDVTFVIEDVPEPDLFDEWRDVVSQELRPAGDGLHFWVGDEGVVRFTGPLDALGEAVSRLEAVIEGSETMVAERREKNILEATERQQQEELFAAAVVRATPSDLPSWITVKTAWESMHEDSPVVTINLVDAIGPFQETWDAFDSTGHPAYHSRGWVVPGLTPEELPEFLERLIPALEVMRTERENAAAESDKRAQPFVAELAARGYVKEPEDRRAQDR